MHTYLIAGGAGFIGSHLCKRLINQHKIICVDNFATGSRGNLSELIDNDRFELIDADICHLDKIHQLKTTPITHILNLACPASPDQYMQAPIATLMTSVQGSHSLLNLAKHHKSKYIFFSTSEVYGDADSLPTTEKYLGQTDTLSDRACYIEGKRSAETLTHLFRHKFQIPTTVLRVFNTYGPNMQTTDGRVVSNFIMAALQESPLRIDGDGHQTRSFCYIDDLIDAIELILDKPDFGPFNVGASRQTTINELATKIKTLCLSSSPLINQPTRAHDPKKRQPCTESFKAATGWSPTIDLDEGLNKTIQYFKGLS